MKKITFIFMLLVVSLTIQAQSNDDKSGDDNNYCVQAAANEIQVVHQGIIIVLDVVLDNGTIIKPDGTIITKDKKRTLLRVGECINQDGTM